LRTNNLKKPEIGYNEHHRGKPPALMTVARPPLTHDNTLMGEPHVVQFSDDIIHDDVAFL
jgi:hypothetical protein